MNDKYFLTDNLFYNNNSLYKINGLNDILVNNINCFKLLKDYGWGKLKIQWRKKLNSSFFSVLECGSDGDCLFHVISEALNLELIYDYKIPEYDVKDIRKMAANEINDDNYDMIVESYKAEVESNEFFGDWDPNNIKTIKELRGEIEKLGDNFWGDHILLQLISEKIKINFLILDDVTMSVSAHGCDLKHDKTIIIYYLENLHFQLVGFFNGKIMQTIFDTNSLPIVI